MIDKYKEITIYEIENGYVLKLVYGDNPNIVNQVSCITTYHKNVEDLVNKLKMLLK